MNPNWIEIAPIVHSRTEFVFRDVRGREELLQVLALRYRLYSTTPGMCRLDSVDHATRLDFDTYDLNSRHFGLFARNGSDDRLVGTLRATGTRTGPMAGLLREIASAHPTLEARVAKGTTELLPMLADLAQAPAVREAIRLRSGEEIAEPGRLTVDPRVRLAAGRRGIRLSHFLVHCALAVGWDQLGLDRVYVYCNERLDSFYRRVGFYPLPGGESTFQQKQQIPMVVFQATPASLPVDLRPEIELCARQLRERGEAIRELLEPTETRCAAA